MAKPGKGLSLLIGIGKKKPVDDGAMPGSTADDPDMDGDMHDPAEAGETEDKATMAAHDLADSLGVPDENKDAFASAFKTAVKACVSSGSEY